MMHSLWTFMLLAVNQIKFALISDNKVRILIKLKIGTESTENFFKSYSFTICSISGVTYLRLVSKMGKFKTFLKP